MSRDDWTNKGAPEDKAESEDKAKPKDKVVVRVAADTVNLMNGWRKDNLDPETALHTAIVILLSMLIAKVGVSGVGMSLFQMMREAIVVNDEADKKISRKGN